MKNKRSTHFIFLNIFLLFLIFGCQSNLDSKKFNKQKKSLTDHIGEKFEISNILDSAGNKIKLDFSKSDLTIIDFWFNDCPPCISEMNQFATELSGKNKRISVISISINQFWLWKKTLKEHTGRFEFLDNSLSNWTQYVLETRDDEKLKNDISVDRLLDLQKAYNVTFFPAYFVVDRNGMIQERPVSAVDYISKL